MPYSSASDGQTRDFDLLKSIEVFISVADTGSMTAAAGRLRITQSAISQQIKLLESHFGVMLFFRDVRPLRLTSAGAMLQKRAASLLYDSHQMRAEVRHAADGKTPRLRVALLSTFANHLVPAILRGVRTGRISTENVTLTRGLTVNHATDLANREIDIAFTSDNFVQTPGVGHIELLQESYVLVTPRGYKTEGKDLKTIAKSLPFLRHTGRTQSGQRIESHLRRLRLELPESAAFEAPSDLIAAVSAGYGWTIASPSQLLGPMEAGAHVDATPLPKPGLNRSIGFVWRSGEMENVVAEMAELCCATLRNIMQPRIATLMPLVADQFRIIGCGDQGQESVKELDLLPAE